VNPFTPRRRVTPRRIGLAVVAVLLVVGGVYAFRIASILVAYKAKMLCSEVLLAQRDPRAVMTELEVDDLTPLRYVSASIDSSGRTVTASVAGLISHRASYGDDRGCVLLFGPQPPTGQALTPRGRHGSTHTLASDTNHALDPVLDRAFAEPNPDRVRRTRAVVIVQDRRIIAERYAPGFTPETPLIGWSMTKTVINALVGILVKEGRLSLAKPVPIAEWHAVDDPRRHITLDQLLRMSSGLRFNESPANPLSDAIISLLRSPETAMYAVRMPLVDVPGRTWRYSSGTTNIISRAVRAVLNDDAQYAELPRRALFDRLSMSRALIEADASGTFVGSSFMYATARDWARLGMLYVNDGVWDGERILPEGWVTYTRTPAPADPLKRYGAHVWLKVAPEYSGDAVLPADAFHAIGHAGQFVTMIPSANLVVVRLGLTRYPDAWDHTAFIRDVMTAIRACEAATVRGCEESER
jgi:CubicO group peptidase (beta-lactamase class C family)